MSHALSYLVCGDAGSGSRRLCEAVCATGLAGVPRAYFAPASPSPDTPDAPDADFTGFEESAWARERGATNFPAFLAAVLAEGRSANGVFAARLPWSSFAPMMEKIRVFTPYGGNATLRQLLRRSFGLPRLLHLERRDRVAQAVRWALDSHTAAAAPRFDPEQVDDLLQRIEDAQAGWESLFDVLEVAPLRLVYEDWSEDLPGSLDAILRWLELPAAEAVFDPKQLPPERPAAHPSLEVEWATRYRSLRGLPIARDPA